jgi:hypothetical protein
MDNIELFDLLDMANQIKNLSIFCNLFEGVNETGMDSLTRFVFLFDFFAILKPPLEENRFIVFYVRDFCKISLAFELYPNVFTFD